MPTLGELSVLIGAEVEEAGFNKAVSALAGIEKAADSAASSASSSMGQLGAAADAGAARYVDATGRLREANGRFVSSATLAAEAANNVGGSLGKLSDVAGKASSSINGSLVASFASFDKALLPLNEGIGRLGESAKDLGGSLTTSVTAPLALLGGLSLKAAGDIQALEKGFAATYTGSEQLSTALAKVQDLAKLPGLGLEEALQGATNLQAAGFSADLAQRSLSAFGNALATVGKGKADLEGVGLALSQIASKGKISAEEINQLAERVPQIRKAMQAAFGTSDTEVLNKLGIDATTFVEKVTTELEKLPKVTGGINNAFENLSDAGTISLAKLGSALNKAFDVEGLLDSLSSAVTRAAQAFSELDPSTQKLIFGIAGAVAAIGPLLFGFGAIAAAIPSVVAGLEVLGLASTAALGPLGIGVAAVAAAAYLIIDNWGSLVAYFSASGEGGRVFSQLASAAKSAAEAVSEAFSTIAANSQSSLGSMVSSQGALSQLVTILAVDLKSAANIFAGTVHGITSLLTGDFSQAFAGAKQAAFGLIDPLAALFGFTVRNTASNPFLVLSKSATEFNAVIPELAANLSLLNSGRLAEIAATAAAARAQLGLLEDLRAKLSALKEQREKETTVGAIRVDNAAIKSLEEQIKKLEETDKTSKAATDAIAKLRLELSRLAALDGVLGDTPSQVEVLDRRISALSSGLKTLVDAGVRPGSRAFQGFVADLINTSQALDSLRASSDLELKPVNIKSLVPKTLGDKLPQDVARLLGDYAKQAVPIELQIPIKVSPLVGGLSDIQKTLEDETLKVSQAFTLASGSALLFGGSFDEAGAKAAALRSEIQTLLDNGVSPLNSAIVDLAGQYAALAAESATTTAATSVVKSGIIDLAKGVGDAFGAALVGTESIGDTLAKTLLSTIGSVATQLGGILVAAGLGIESLKVSLATFQGAGALVAGAALLAIGGLAKAQIGALSNRGSSIASTPRANYGTSPAVSNAPLKVQVEVVGELRGRGQDLVAVLRGANYRELRTR
jgi:tape measure domain-containing protein